MCRYAWHTYKSHYACFRCRKVYRQRPDSDLAEEQAAARSYSCPQCGEPMKNMGLDFKAPAQRDKKQWQKVEILYRNGFAFHSCGCGPGRRPRKLREVPGFLELNWKPTEAERILSKKAHQT